MVIMLSRFRKKYIGDKAFYKMVLSVAFPIMIQNGLTNFVSLLDNIMVGRLGAEEMPDRIYNDKEEYLDEEYREFLTLFQLYAIFS